MEAIALLLAANLGLAQAFTLNGSSSLLGWDREVLTMTINLVDCQALSPNTHDRVFNAIGSAADLWNSVATSSIQIARGDSSPTTPGAAYNEGSTDGPNIICDDDLAGTLGITASETNGIAGVGIGLAKDGGIQIDYGYLLLNATPGQSANMENLSDTTLSVVVAHEMGHVLGLGHSSSENALMYFAASAKTELSLAQDDIDAITLLYPRKGLFGCGSIRDQTGEDGSAIDIGDDGVNGATSLAGFFLFCALVTLFLRRKPNVHARIVSN